MFHLRIPTVHPPVRFRRPLAIVKWWEQGEGYRYVVLIGGE